MTLAASAQVMHSRRDELPERSQAALDLLIGDVSRFQGLVGDLLEISRFDAGAIRLIKEPLALLEFVRQAIAVSSLPRTDVIFAAETDQILVQGDKRRLARVFANLIDNALEAAQHAVRFRAPAVRVTLDDVGTNLIFDVEDSGFGLAADLDTIFTPQYS